MGSLWCFPLLVALTPWRFSDSHLYQLLLLHGIPVVLPQDDCSRSIYTIQLRLSRSRLTQGYSKTPKNNEKEKFVAKFLLKKINKKHFKSIFSAEAFLTRIYYSTNLFLSFAHKYHQMSVGFQIWSVPNKDKLTRNHGDQMLLTVKPSYHLTTSIYYNTIQVFIKMYLQPFFNLSY
jgi:hypothetical protein